MNSGSTEAVVSSVSNTAKPKANTQNRVLLQTVKAWTEGPARTKIVRCLLDGGSFIHEGVVKALGLPVLGKETLHPHTFGSAAPVTVQSNIVKVSLQNVWNTQQKIEIEAVELPWRHEKSALPDNFRVAKRWFESLKRRLKMDATLYYRYNDVITDYLQQGICEDVTESTAAEEHPENVKYCMPHHAVLREDKATTKLRVVFDASSGCPSLNDCLLTGPNLNPNLLDALIKFRLHQIAFTADITKAFLQIALAEKDKDAVRFLWLHGPPHKNCEDELRIMRMSRVVFGVSPSPFLVAATVRKHRDFLYIDDFISSSSDVDEAFSVSTTAKEILSHAGMNLCKWVTNSPDLRAKWTQHEVEHTKETGAGGNVLKVLGLVWRSEKDEFVFDLKGLLDIVKGKENTKRSVLQTSVRIFDPKGFLTPFTIWVKCLFQELWERGISWDEQLPTDLAEKWDQWCAELPRLHLVAIPRWYDIEIQP